MARYSNIVLDSKINTMPLSIFFFGALWMVAPGEYLQHEVDYSAFFPKLIHDLFWVGFFLFWLGLGQEQRNSTLHLDVGNLEEVSPRKIEVNEWFRRIDLIVDFF